MNEQPNKESPAREATEQIDALVREHFRSTSGDDAEAPISVSDRWGWAKSLHVDLELIDARLEKLCSPLPPEDEHETVPRYRLRQPA